MLLFINLLMELKRTVPLLFGENSKQEADATIIVPSESHRHLLWLLQEHVLSIHTYGEFDVESQSSTGKVTVTLQSSALWMENWLRCRVELASGESTK